MLSMPLPCKVVTSFNSEVTVRVFSSGSGNIVEDTLAVYPANLGEIREVSWVNLTYTEVMDLEYYLMKSKATERFLWNGLYYVLEDGYTIEVQANHPIVTARFRRVR